MRALIRNTKQRIVIVSPGFNCEKWVDLWYNSLIVQNYPNWIAIPIDDHSDDFTSDVLVNLHKQDKRIVPIYRFEHYGALRNRYEVINNKHLIKDNDIIIFIDLDDWFGTKYAFEKTIQAYQYWDIGATTGTNFSLRDYYSHEGKFFTDEDELVDAETQEYSLFSFKAKYFRRIPKQHFINPKTNNFYDICEEFVFGPPILYQVGPNHHFHHFDDRLIIYNNIRAESDDKKIVDGKSAQELVRPLIVESFKKLIGTGDIFPYYDG